MRIINAATVFILLGGYSGTANGAEIKYVSQIGQSQMAPQMIVPFLDTHGGAVLPSGDIWTMDYEWIYSLKAEEGKGFTLVKKFKNQFSTYKQMPIMKSDGENIFFNGKDSTIYCFTPDRSRLDIQPLVKLSSAKFPYWNVIPGNVSKGIGKNGKLLIFQERKITVFDKKGKQLGEPLQLPGTSGKSSIAYSSVGIAPDGDILASTTYPDYRVYRYNSCGKEITAGVWPRKVWNPVVTFANDRAWALSNYAVELVPDKLKDKNALQIVNKHTTTYPRAIAQMPDSKGYVIFDANGIIFFDSKGQSKKCRIGGLPGCHALAIDSAGTVIAINKKSRFLKLYLDSVPDEPLDNGANEPWHVGGQWLHKTCAIHPLEEGIFIVMDQTSGQLWKYTPSFEHENNKCHIPLTAAHTFNKPKDFAISENNFIVLEDYRIIEGKRSDYSKYKPTSIPVDKVRFVTVLDDNNYVTVTDNMVKIFTRIKGNQFQSQKELKGFGFIRGVAVKNGKIAVSDSKYLKVSVISSEKGVIEAAIDFQKIPGKFYPLAVAMNDNYIVVSDVSSCRLVLLQFIP